MKQTTYIQPRIEVMAFTLQPLMDNVFSPTQTEQVGVSGTTSESDSYTGGTTEGSSTDWESDGLSTTKRRFGDYEW